MRKIFYFFSLLLFASCTNIDCPLDNVVMMTSGFYNSEDGTSMKLTDVQLSVLSGDGRYTLVNRIHNESSIMLPLRQGVANDTLLFVFDKAEGQLAEDTLFLSYTDIPHFESIDCPASLFHELKEVRWTSHALAQLPLTIDKVEIVRSLVNYDDVENLKIYLRSTAH